MLPVNKTFYQEYFEESSSSEKIYLLSEKEAIEVWGKEIDWESKCYFDLADDHWLVVGERKSIGEWMTAYHENKVELVANILRSCRNWDNNKTVLFLINRKNIFQLSWYDFLLNWDCFLSIEDDCPVVIPQVNPLKEAILFQHLGGVYTINRSANTNRLDTSCMTFDGSIMVSA